jgi:hypothetical protein
LNWNEIEKKYNFITIIKIRTKINIKIKF